MAGGIESVLVVCSSCTTARQCARSGVCDQDGDVVTPDMVDRGARKLAQLWGDVEWDELEPEALESYRRDAEVVLRAALHRDAPGLHGEGLLKSEGSNDG